MSKRSILLLAVFVLFIQVVGYSQNGAGASAISFPVIVAKRSFIGQVGPIPQTTLFVPSKSGTFRISCYIDTATNPPDGNDVIDVSWSDDFNVNAGGVELTGAEGETGETFSQGTLVIHDKAGAPIVVNGQGTTAANTYNAYVIVEQL